PSTSKLRGQPSRTLANTAGALKMTGAEGSRKGLPCRGPSRLLATLGCACAVGTVAAGGAGGAQARPTHPASPISGAGAAAGTPPACVIHSLPSLIAGPECEAGESLVSAHLEQEPFETFTTSFTVLPPVTTPPGVFALPGTQVEDAASSGVAAIIQVEFAGGSEKRVRIGSEELFARCRVEPKLRWFQIVGGTEGAEVREVSGVSEVTGVTLDNDGNAFG